LAVLDRGYALVLSTQGTLIRSTTQITSGEQLTTRLADGSFLSRVETVTLGAPAAPKPRKRGKRSAK
jgi:exodeoxyribonuclease VII large subunit